jgi:uncharacterized RDD family membrane protein YckC
MVPMQTQPAPTHTDPTAVMGRRIFAYLIDVVIGLAVMAVLFFAIAKTATLPTSSQASRVCDVWRAQESSSICINIGSDVYATSTGDSRLIFGVLLAYGVFFQLLLPGVSGYSIGKAIMGLRVVKQSDGKVAGIGPNALRWILGVVDFGLCFLPALITSLSSKGHRRLGDMAAGTLVVDKSQMGTPPIIAGLTTAAVPVAPWAPPPAATPHPPGSVWAATPPSVPPTATADSPPSFPPPSVPQAAPPTFPPPTTPPLAASPPSAPPTAVAEAGEDTTTSMPTVGADEPTTAMPTVDESPSAADTPEAPEPPEVPEAPEAPEAPVEAEVPEAPEAPAAPEPPEAPVEAAPPGVAAPYWDEARSTYIQWDPELGQWMEWSNALSRWVPIST